MPNWLEVYRSKMVTAEKAVEAIQSKQRVFLTGNCSVPQTVLAALVRRAPQLDDVEICQVLTVGPADYVQPGLEGHLRVNTLFISDNVRAAVNEGRADFSPCRLSEIPLLFSSGRIPLDVALIHVSPPDEHGFCSYGIEVGVTKTAAAHARVVIAEVNPQMPRTLGDSFIHVSQLDCIVECQRPILELPRRPAEEVHSRIAGHVARLVEDGSTLQLGIGGIPDAVLKGLTDRKDLGVHTEMFSDGVMELIEAGVITNERKTLHRGKIIAGFLIGSTRLYEFVDNNAMVELHPNDYTNDPFVIAANDRMVAINSALQVDLTGQVCADSMGTSIYSGVGGQTDFMRGAARSKGGKPIIALPSTAKNGAVSRIVPTLDPGAGVVTTRADVHYVVTEYGAAFLHGKTLRQRAEALIGIAHPDFRERLLSFAIEHRYLDRSAGSPALAAG